MFFNYRRPELTRSHWGAVMYLQAPRFFGNKRTGISNKCASIVSRQSFQGHFYNRRCLPPMLETFCEMRTMFVEWGITTGDDEFPACSLQIWMGCRSWYSGVLAVIGFMDGSLQQLGEIIMVFVALKHRLMIGLRFIIVIFGVAVGVLYWPRHIKYSNIVRWGSDVLKLQSV